MGKGTPWPWRRAAEEEQELEMHVDLMDCYSRQHAAWVNRVEAWLSRHWPELEELLEIGSVTVLRMLAHYGSPAALAGDGEAGARLRGWGGPMLTKEKIARVIAGAGATVGIRCSRSDGERVQTYAREALATLGQIHEHRQALQGLKATKPDIERLAAVVGLATACVLHASVGDPAGYPSPRAYVKALGLNLTERSSGEFQSQRHISKRGPSRPRRWLYFAGLRLVQKEGVKQWYQRKVARDGGKRTPALVAVMRKLGLALYRVCKDGVEFDAQKLFAPPRPRRRPRSGRKEVAMP
jgi:hypothetical protein